MLDAAWTPQSPIYAHFSETLNGTVSIRAYGDQRRFIKTNGDRLDTNQAAYFIGTVANRWLAVRLELIGMRRRTVVSRTRIVTVAMKPPLDFAWSTESSSFLDVLLMLLTAASPSSVPS